MQEILKKIVTAIFILEAKLVLRKYRPRIIAVTGSVGKTSTKDAIYAVFADGSKVRKSEKSYNSEIGLPLTIIGRRSGWKNPLRWLANLWSGLSLLIFSNDYPDWLILEVGADRPDDIKKVAEWLYSDAAVITRLAKVPVHVEFFATPEAVVFEKSRLIDTIRDEGTLILNADDDDVVELKESFRGKTITFGFSGESNLRASNFQLAFGNEGGVKMLSGITFKITFGDNVLPVTIKGALGRGHAYAALAAVAVGISQGKNLVNMVEALGNHITQNGRMKIITGLKGSTIIDDTYNASPVALHEALETLRTVEGARRKIAILGDMMELGSYSVEEHRKAGLKAAGCSDLLFTVGVRARDIAEGALEAGMNDDRVMQFDGAVEVGEYLQNLIGNGDLILVKGSQSMRLERVVEEIMASPEKAGELLVRQEPEWEKK